MLLGRAPPSRACGQHGGVRTPHPRHGTRSTPTLLGDHPREEMMKLFANNPNRGAAIGSRGLFEKATYSYFFVTPSYS